MTYLVSYDIADDKDRNKVSDILSGYGSRVQYSVFECIFEKNDIKTATEKIIPFVKGSDSIRFYFLCKDCLKNAFVIGNQNNENSISGYEII